MRDNKKATAQRRITRALIKRNNVLDKTDEISSVEMAVTMQQHLIQRRIEQLAYSYNDDDEQ